MSLPRLCAMPTSTGNVNNNNDIDKEKQSRHPGFSGFPIGMFNPAFGQAAAAAAAAAAAGASVFPTGLPGFFPPQLLYYAAHFQQQQHAMQQALQQHSPLSRIDLSPTVSDGRASSTIDTSPVRRLQVDEDGIPICPICDEKMGNEKQWMEHVQLERQRLHDAIVAAKQATAGDLQLQSAKMESLRRKRETELQRIRCNQQKRLNFKATSTASTALFVPQSRESGTPFSRQSIDSPSSSPTEQRIKKIDEVDEHQHQQVHHEETAAFSENMQCKGCHRNFDHLVVSSHSDQPRCYDCFKKLRSQTAVLPNSLTENEENGSLNLKLENGFYGSSKKIDNDNNTAKRARIEI